MNQNLLLPTTLLASLFADAEGGLTAAANAYACIYKKPEDNFEAVGVQTKKKNCMHKGEYNIEIDTSNKEGVICEHLGPVRASADILELCLTADSLWDISYTIKGSTSHEDMTTLWGAKPYDSETVSVYKKKGSSLIEICIEAELCKTQKQEWDITHRDGENNIYFIYNPSKSPLDSTLETPVSHNSPAADAEL